MQISPQRRIADQITSRPLLFVAVAAFAATFLAWLPALSFGLLQDDYVGVVLAGDRWHWWNVQDYFAPLDAQARYLRPLPPLTHYFDDRLFGPDDVWGWHLGNLLLHSLNAALVATLFVRFGRIPALAAGLAFGLHPLALEPAGWISARPDLLMVTFLLAAALLARRGNMIFSALAFVAAMLSKEAAVVFPFVLVGWLYLTKRPLSTARFHWLALAGYIVYRGAVLSPLAGGSWTEEPLAWMFEPWRTLAFPGVTLQPSWTWIAGAFFLGIPILAIKCWRATWPWAVLTLAALVTTLPVYQMSSDFQFGRYLYLALVGWAAIVAVVIRSLRYRQAAVLAIYVACLVLVGLTPRSAMAQAGELADLISGGVSAQVQDLAPEEVVLVEAIPVRHQGFVLYGGYLELAARRMAKMARTGVPHRILDAAWDRDTGQFDATALPDVVLEWDADASAMHRCRVSGPTATESAGRGDNCAHVAPATDFDLGSTDLRRYRAAGFRWNEAADSISWNWITRPMAEMLLPLPTDDDYLIHIRGMSATPNTVRLWLNGQVIGQHEIVGDFVWQEQVSVISRAQWRDAPFQSVAIEATESTDGLYVAIDRIWLEPVGPVASFDFGSIDLFSLRASGFRNNESDSTASWNWMVERGAEVHLPLPPRAGASVEIRAMSVVPSWLTVELNGSVLGHAQIPGNFRWVDVQFEAAPETWVGSGPQRLGFRATDMRDGFFVAIDAMVVRYR